MERLQMLSQLHLPEFQYCLKLIGPLFFVKPKIKEFLPFIYLNILWSNQ